MPTKHSKSHHKDEFTQWLKTFKDNYLLVSITGQGLRLIRADQMPSSYPYQDPSCYGVHEESFNRYSKSDSKFSVVTKVDGDRPSIFSFTCLLYTSDAADE